MAELQYLDAGRMAYAAALDLQKRRLADVQAAKEERAYLLLVEHDPPVITTGRRPCAEHILATPEQLAREGIQVHAARRGGGVTYHGPGQLVGYPILRLASIGRSVRTYVHGLEESLVLALGRFGLGARRVEGLTGVWVGDEKIAAIGVAVTRGVTYHGFALNVATNLSHFGLVVPCGLRGRGVTSMSKCLGRPMAVDEVKPALIDALKEVLGGPSLGKHA